MINNTIIKCIQNLVEISQSMDNEDLDLTLYTLAFELRSLTTDQSQIDFFDTILTGEIYE